MRRFLTILFTALLLTAALCISASASSFDRAVEELSAIGIFKGTASGFQLDQVPTRAQAAIMLVRLYGAEEEAKAAYDAGELTHPFTDVSETAAPHVAWLVENGLSNGTSATTFGASNPCTAQAYTVFLLRALGYKDGTDFAFADAQAFGLNLGLFSPSMITGTFLRDDLAALTYQALACDLKDGSTYLLDSLIQSGAIDPNAAKPITDKIEAYRALETASMESVDGCIDADFDIKANVSYSVAGQSGGQNLNMSESMDMAGSGNAKVIIKDDDMQMAMTLNFTMEDEMMEAELWLKDGAMYIRSGEEAYKQEIPGLAELYQTAIPNKTNMLLLPFLKSVTSKASGTDTVYTLELNDAFTNIINDSVSDILGAELGNGADIHFSMDGSAFTYTIANNSQLKNAAVKLNIDVEMDMNLGAEEQGTIKISMKMDMDMNVKATGQDVKITFPDFSGFKANEATSIDVIGGTDGPTAIFLT